MSIFSYFSKKSDPNYEEILTDIENKIAELESQLTQIQIQHHTISASLLVYGIGGYIIYLVTYWLILHTPHEPMEVKLLKISPIFGVPILIFILRWLSSTIHDRRAFSKKSKLQKLKNEQKQKVEELKEKTSFNSVQKMLLRFDPELKQNQLRQRVNPNNQNRNSQNPNRQPSTPSAPPGGKAQHRGLTKSTSTPSLKDKARQQANLKSPNDIPVTSEFHPNAQDYSPMGERAWYDKIVDVLIGEEDFQKQFALICPHCHQHNGLVSAQDYEMIQYTCPKCEKFIPSRASQRTSPVMNHPRPSFGQTHMNTMNRPIQPHSPNNGSPNRIPSRPVDFLTNDEKQLPNVESQYKRLLSPEDMVPVIKEEDEPSQLESEIKDNEPPISKRKDSS